MGPIPFDLFLGKPVDYWLALQERAECLNVTGLLDEVASLNARVSYYERRFDEISEFRTHTNKRLGAA